MRQIPHLKIHLISITWVVVVFLFPMINEAAVNLDLNTLFIIGGAHYLYVIAVAIPFDIRDLKYDTPEQKTIPQVIGVRASKIVSMSLLGMFALIMVYFVDSQLINNKGFLVAIEIQMILVAFMNEKRSDIYCAGLIDGSIALLGLSYFLT